MLRIGLNIPLTNWSIVQVSNGYEIRLELLKMAKDFLDREYAAKLEAARKVAELNNAEIVLPPSYTIDDISVKAGELNKFVNQKN